MTQACRLSALTCMAMTLTALHGYCASEDAAEIASRLTPQPQQLTRDEGEYTLSTMPLVVQLPAGAEHEACRDVITTALAQCRMTIDIASVEELMFVMGQRSELPELPELGPARDGYVLRVTSHGVTARGASAAGLLYASQTLRQLLRLYASDGCIPALTVIDYPRFPLRGIYIEGGQERFGRIVSKEYLCEQIRQLSAFKMNALVIECYNLFPYASFSACADQGTLSEEECREVFAEAARYHVTLIPSLQTLAQASELVWNCEEGTLYREETAPGLMCPSSPEIYPLIKGFYRDLLRRFSSAPVIGIGCSEIDMQWQQRYCPECQRRIDAGETVRDLLLGHAEQCIQAVHEVAEELDRPVRPLMWGDEFYMYGPGKDWVGIERISQDTVMGYWKYWPDYAGIEGLLQRGYDVLGISAMYNHCFYLADLSPDKPAKAWPPMEQTGILNITQMLQAADTAQQAGHRGTFWGVATASFSKHRLRAFDSIWYGFALNGHAAWSHAERPLLDYQDSFTHAFVRHYYDARTNEATSALARAYVRLDKCKSQLERANQAIHDVVGVYDTQEPGYQGNTLLKAFGEVASHVDAAGQPDDTLTAICDGAKRVIQDVADCIEDLAPHRAHIGQSERLADLGLAAAKIEAHAQRQLLMSDTQCLLTRYRQQPTTVLRRLLSVAGSRWRVHRATVKQLRERSEHLYSQGDPLRLQQLEDEMAAIEQEFAEALKAEHP